MSCSNVGKGLLIFVGGAALGAALGILFAPDKGVNTRGKIGKAARDLKDDVVDKLEDLVDAAEDIVDDLKEKAAGVANEAKATAAKAKKAKA